MGHYVTAYCETHGEVDMDDGRAFCEDCYEVTPKGALAEARAEIERLKQTVEYKDKGLFDMAVELTGRGARIAELEAECEELRADVVFASTHRIQFGGDVMTVRHVGPLFSGDTYQYIPCDVDNPAEIQLAVREARNGVS